MEPQASLFLTLDLPAMLAGAFAAAACALVGCFLVLRRMSLMGDAISHAALPGLVAAFLISGSNHTLPMLTGAVVVGILTTALTELVYRLSKVEPGAAMGVVFTTLFAIGVIMLERAAGGNAHIDADCVLYGQLESVSWLNAPASFADIWLAESWAHFPRQVTTLAVAFALTLAFVVLCYRPLKITSFDPALAASLGIRAGLVRYALMTVTAVVSVAAFEAVGSILVVAMLIVPAMAAHLLTDRLAPMLVISVVISVVAAVVGYALGAFGPRALGSAASVSAAGMMGVALGATLALTALFAPRHGALSRLLRRAALRAENRRDDLLAALFRAAERAGAPGAAAVLDALPEAHGRAGAGALRAILRSGDAALHAGGVALTPAGEARAARVVRAHRLWETYLVDEMGLRPDHVHDAAERLEHVTDPIVERALADIAGRADTDPHGRPIPRAPTGR